jgi:hypothetical protein
MRKTGLACLPTAGSATAFSGSARATAGTTIDPTGSMSFDVPEPASVLFFGSGLAALGVARCRRRRGA